MRLYSTETHPKVWAELEELLDYVHPLMRDSFYYAAIPLWYNVPLFVAVRAIDDKRSEPLVRDRLSDYPFIINLPDMPDSYMVHAIERSLLNWHCINHQPELYIVAHQRAYAHWGTVEPKNVSEEYIRERSLLYHQLFVDLDAGTSNLIDLYDKYATERQLGAMEQLLERAQEARYFLTLLNGPNETEPLNALLLYMQARLSQMLGQWQTSLAHLEQIDPSALPSLQPYTARAHGYYLANYEGQYADAIAKFEEAIAFFDSPSAASLDPTSVKADRARTVLAMGDAHVHLAHVAQGHVKHQLSEPGILGILGNLYHVFLSLPLLVFLQRNFGRRVLRPRFWPIFGQLDWVVARFFTRGARLYQEADTVLELHANPAEGVAADEQLARLYVRMGDADEARRIFDELLTQEEVTLSPFQRASMQVGLGEALLALGEFEAAETQLRAALPVLRKFKHREREVEALQLLGEALTFSADPSNALEPYETALLHHKKQANTEIATRIATELDHLLDAKQFSEPAEARARELSDQLPVRLYAVRYRDRATRFLRRFSIIAFFVVAFFIAILTVRLAQRQIGVPKIDFNVAPILIDDTDTFIPDLSQSVPRLTVLELEEPNILIMAAIGLFLLYLAVATALGLFALMRASAKRLQAARHAQLIEIGDDYVQKGRANDKVRFAIDAIERVTIADFRSFEQANHDDSVTVFATADEAIAIHGNTTHYETVRQKLLERVPASAEIRDLSFSLLHSKMGLLFIVTAALMVVLTLISEVWADGLFESFYGSYSLADLYAYYFLGFFLPPMWWFVYQPIRIRRELQPYSRLHLWVGLIGFGTPIFFILTGFRVNLTTPNIYPPLAALIFTGVATWRFVDIYLNKLPPRREKARTNWLETLDQITVLSPLGRTFLTVASVLGFVLITSVMGNYLWREMRTHFYIVRANEYAERASTASVEATAARLLQNALDDYSNAIDSAETTILGVESGQNSAELYANRGAAYLSSSTIGDSTTVTDTVASTNTAYLAAITDFSEAIDRDPTNGEYPLWRGFAQQALGNTQDAIDDYTLAIDTIRENRTQISQPATQVARAYTGIGWLNYTQRNYTDAATAFEMAVNIAEQELARQEREATVTGWRQRVAFIFPPEPVREETRVATTDANLGLGYALYADRKFNEVGTYWERAQQLAPDNPLPVIDLGTLSWRLATLGDDFSAEGTNRCAIATLPEAEKLRSETQLFDAITHFERSLTIGEQSDRELAFTHRTIGFVNALLSPCPSTNAREMYEAAADSFGEAANWQPENAVYPQWQGRMSYTAWSLSELSGPIARNVLFEGLQQLQIAYALDPVDNPSAGYRPAHWINEVVWPQVGVTIQRGDSALEAGDYASAFGYYRHVADIDTTTLPDERDEAYGFAKMLATFDTGLAAWLNGDPDEAETRYTQAIELARKGDDSVAVTLEAWCAVLEQAAIHERPTARMDAVFLASGVNFIRAALPQIAELPELCWIGIQERIGANFEQLEAAEDPASVRDAVNLGLIAMILQDYERSAEWYNEAIRRTVLDSSRYRTELLPFRDDLRRFWESSDRTGDILVQMLDARLPILFADYPEMQDDGLFWRRHAWFKYHLGQGAFLAGDEDVARLALDLAQPDADRAAELGSPGGDEVHTYLPEGAWGWYLYVRGTEQFDAEQYEDAAESFALSAEAYAPDQNDLAKEEATEAAFRAALSALAAGDGDSAERWTAEAINRTTRYNTVDTLTKATEAIRVFEVDEAMQATQARIIALLDAYEE